MKQLMLKGVTKNYRGNGAETPVLKGISLEVESGETLGIVGPSGAGKTTLLNIIGTLDSPTAGEIFFEGSRLTDLMGEELCRFRNLTLGFVFQFHHLLPDFDACENVMMPLLIRGLRRKEAGLKAKNMLERVGLGPRLHHRPSQLSGGEQQRVALARALVGSPRLVLADEPTGNLDAVTGRQIFDLLLSLNGELNTTLIVVSHNEGLIARLARTIRIMDGQIKL